MIVAKDSSLNLKYDDIHILPEELIVWRNRMQITLENRLCSSATYVTSNVEESCLPDLRACKILRLTTKTPALKLTTNETTASNISPELEELYFYGRIINNYRFSGCGYLRKVIAPYVTGIGYCCFNNCGNLDLFLPRLINQLGNVNDECFSVLKSVRFPTSFISFASDRLIGNVNTLYLDCINANVTKPFCQYNNASAQGEDSESVKDRLTSMTVNDFFRYCAIGYAENKCEGCDKTPKEQYYLHADGRDEGLRELDMDDPEAFHAWLHDRSHGGGHPWEVCRGGNSTHVSLCPIDDENEYYLNLDGDAWNRTIETVKFYLALTRAGIPVYLLEAHTLADRLAEKEWIGIVPDGVMPAYCESWFPKEHIIDYMNLPYDDRERFLPFCVWYDEEPIKLLSSKEGITE